MRTVFYCVLNVCKIKAAIRFSQTCKRFCSTATSSNTAEYKPYLNNKILCYSLQLPEDELLGKKYLVTVLVGGCTDYQNLLCVLFSSIFLCYRVYKVRGNLFQIFPMKFCPSTGRFKSSHFAL